MYNAVSVFEERLIVYELIHIIHIYSVFVYGGFLIVDNLFLAKMKHSLDEQAHAKAREAIMTHVRRVVPYALFIAVGSGIYMFVNVFGQISQEGMSHFQLMLSIKAFLGLWLGLRGFNQKVFGIDPWLFKSHIFPFSLVLVIIFLSQIMHL